jgi:methanogenic corrinoid protein MtbC1
MLRWCAYCQQFLGEAPDYQKLTISHGICAACAPHALELTESDSQLAKSLRAIYQAIYEAGWRNDLAAAERIIETAHEANIRTVDVLMGVVAPLLYQVGEEWKQNLRCVADEHRFTSFCNTMFRLIAAKEAAPMPDCPNTAEAPAMLLMNAPGNRHTLAIRILSLWLRNKGFGVQMLDEPPPLHEFLALVLASRIRVVLLSMALAEQLSAVVEIVERIAELPRSNRPRVVVGGYAVKLGYVSAIPGADLLGDISLL